MLWEQADRGGRSAWPLGGWTALGRPPAFSLSRAGRCAAAEGTGDWSPTSGTWRGDALLSSCTILQEPMGAHCHPQRGGKVNHPPQVRCDQVIWAAEWDVYPPKSSTQMRVLCWHRFLQKSGTQTAGRVPGGSGQEQLSTLLIKTNNKC